MDVQAIKKPRKTVKLYGKQFSTQQMGVQVSCSIHTKVPVERFCLRSVLFSPNPDTSV